MDANTKFAHNGLAWHTFEDVVKRYKNRSHTPAKEAEFTESYARHTRFEANPWKEFRSWLEANPFPSEWGQRSSEEILKEFF